MAINQDITNLPTPPSRSDSPSDFSDKADSFLGALPQLQTELNTYADEANATQQVINTSESNAATSETNAEDWASKTDGIVLTTDYSAKAYAISDNLIPEGAAKEWAIKTGSTVDGTDFSAKKYAGDAEASASAAAATAGATAWSAGTTYDTNDAAIGSDGNTYRSLVDGNLGNDPVADGGTNWLNLTATLSDQEVRDLFSASGDLTYDASTGVFSVTTATVQDILKPHVISPIDGETEVVETPTIKTGGYYSLFGIEQASAQFQVATDSAFSNIVYDSGVLGAVTEHQVPAGNLVENTTHYVRVEFKDTSNNTSGFSETREFNTESTFADLSDPNNIGIAVGGGFLAGNVVSDVDSQTYAIIVSDGDGDTDRTGAGSKQWRTSNTALTEAQTLADGKSVMDHIVNNETLSDFPAFEWIQTTLNNANYNGYSDWYLPARDELELIYRHFKPTTENNNDGTRDSVGFGGDGATNGTNNSSDPNGSGYTTSDPSQTSITSFQNGGADYLTDNRYWSSTEASASFCWLQLFNSGSQNNGFNKDGAHRVRAVRRVAV